MLTMWLRTCLCLLAIVAYGTANDDSSDASIFICPSGCQCTTTPESLHKAVCHNTAGLRKFSQKNKHHNINILDLSRKNITKLNNDLDKFTEVVSIDLSHNNIKVVNKFLQNSKKLVHVNLRDNKLKTFSATVVPNSVSSLDLRDNFLENVPSDLYLLKDLEHLELEGNPIHCSCENLKLFNKLINSNIVVDDVACATPHNRLYEKMSKLKVSDLCSKDVNKQQHHHNLDDMMLGDAPADDSEVYLPSTTNKKSMEIEEENNLDIGETWEGNGSNTENDDDKEFYGVVSEKSTLPNDKPDPSIEGSGDLDDGMTPLNEEQIYSGFYVANTSEIESGDGSGSGQILNLKPTITTDVLAEEDYDGSGMELENMTTTTTEIYITGLFDPFFETNSNGSTVVDHFVTHESPKIFQGTINWSDDNDDTSSTVKSSTVEAPVVQVFDKETVNREPFQRKQANSPDETIVDPLSGDSPEESREATKTSVGTYICIGIIIALLVGLIGFSAIKGRINKNRDRRLLRQQKQDVEKGAKEMADMNKALIGKVAIPSDDKDKMTNGNYELVPTHETFKKTENGHALETTPKDKPKIVDGNNQAPEKNELVQNGNTNKGDDDPHDTQPTICVTPTNPQSDYPYSLRDGYPEHNLNSPSEYTPVYSPDMGRVKIKLTETPKPKTPVLINRSRSNAGDIIITPAITPDQNSPVKSTT